MKERILLRGSAPLLFIALCWITAAILVDPSGEFPSNDDWAYFASVRALVEQGKISFSDWTSPNLISQVFWGALFALAFGVHYTVLRLSTFVAALLASFALFYLIRGTGRPLSLALLAALLLLFNPIFFLHSFTFMTDVPFVAAQTGAMLFLLAGLRSDSARLMGAGWLFALVSLLCRQTGFAIPLAYLAAFLVKNGFRRITTAVLPLIFFVVVQWSYQYWLNSSGKMPAYYGKQAEIAFIAFTGSATSLVASFSEVVVSLFLYLGLFLLPVSFPALVTLSKALPRNVAAIITVGIAAVTIVTACVTLESHKLLPTRGNTWNTGGFGPDASGLSAPDLFWQVVTVLSVFGGAVLFFACAALSVSTALRERGSDTWGFVFGFVGASVLAGVLGLVAIRFDRYLLPLIPWLSLSLVFAVPVDRNLMPRWSVLVGGILLSAMAWYSIVNLHNYFAEKRVRVAAIEYLTARGVARDSIDAGWVFNGDLFYGRYGQPGLLPPLSAGGAWSHDWYRTRNYIVGTSPEPGYTVLHRFPVPRWQVWGSRGQDVLILGQGATLKSE
jgi:4-amino-4-deoxy-L-arabinose transferase-like glycosyltransferase